MATRVGIADVALAAGVSRTTVSHALTGKRRVSSETKARVLEAAERLNYRANAIARSLRTQQSDTIAIIVPDITNPFYPVLARGVQDAMSDEGYQVVVCSTDADRARESRYLAAMISRSVDGMILDLFRTPSADLEDLVASGIPCVLLGSMEAPEFGDRVIGDDRVSVSRATAHLLRGGRTRIAFVGAVAGVGPSDDRRAGYIDALLSAGRSVDKSLVLHADYSRIGARDALARLILTGVKVDAVVCANDLAAIGAMDAVRAAGLSVPGDVAVIGFDDIEAAALVSPALTTIVNHAYDKGLICGRLLLQRISGELTGEFRRIVVPGTLVLRETA